MADQHCATVSEWACIERMLHHAEFSCILELLHRVKALEAAQPPQPSHPEIPDSSPLCVRCWAAAAAAYTRAKPSYPEIPGGSLKERIKSRMIDMIEGIGSTWDEAAASVLTEVAAWLRKHYGGPTATSDLLEQEAER